METEARAARAALVRLDHGLVDEALRRAAVLLRERRSAVLAANRADVENASSRVDEGALDRLRLDDARVEAMVAGLEATAMRIIFSFAAKARFGRKIKSRRTRDHQGMEVSLNRVGWVGEWRPPLLRLPRVTVGDPGPRSFVMFL